MTTSKKAKNKEKATSADKSIILFDDVPVRRVWVEKEEKWYFSIIDVIAVLTSQANFKKAQSYWTTLKNRLKQEGNESVTKCDKLKLQSTDGKFYKTDVANVEGLFRIIQSIPSKKAEPFKRWLAKVGYERLQETVDPERAVNRARRNWKTVGRSTKWIEQRMRGQEVRNKLTDYWGDNKVKEGVEFAKLTDIIHKEWADLTTREHKTLKNLKTENLRDNMSEAELIFTALAELSTTSVAKKDKSKGYDENADSAHKGGGVAKRARKDYELQTGQKVVSGDNFLPSNKKKKELER
ncbi:MAG: Bro-N domain-containing protein [Parcubacteria group bacterium]|nr:Bro-N domain-containing protein [Parcubacteria group bacterium]